jgi:two-component system, cell cycle sensor histidine kinase and response regulator CckA
MPIFGNQRGELLQAILDNVGAGIAVADAEGKLVFANDTAISIFGMDSLSKPIDLKDCVRDFRFQDRHGHDIPLERSALMRALAGERMEPQDIRLMLPNGESKWLHTSTHPFSVMGLSGVLIIITDETANVELSRTASQLQRMEDVASIALGMAHNFNNVLNTISVNAALALADEGLPESTRGRLEQITNGSQKASAVVQRLAQFSRKREMQTRPVQINRLVKDALNLVQPVLTNRVHVHTALRDDLPEVEANPSDIEQVLVNLIVNARDAMPMGGELTIATEIEYSKLDEASTEQHIRQFVIITVADTGIGIREDIQGRIFDPFFTTKTAENGTGLGLSSAYGIVRQHEGTIDLWSAPGKGTKFTIHLPVRQFVKNTVPTYPRMSA